jgi:lipoate-protein ligase A
MEVTYSVSIPQSDPLYALGLETSYKWICGPIVAALLAIGVSAALAPHGSTGFVSASCFTAPGTTDIVADHRKIVGSAQMRTRDGFLQHGSVILKNDLEKLFAVVRTSQSNVHDAVRRATRLITSVSDEAHRAVSFGEMANALAAAFSAAEGVRLLPDSLTAREALNAADIVARKYGREDWNALR